MCTAHSDRSDLNCLAGDDNTAVVILASVGAFMCVVVVAAAYYCRVRLHEKTIQGLIDEDNRKEALLKERLVWISVRAMVGQATPWASCASMRQSGVYGR